MGYMLEAVIGPATVLSAVTQERAGEFVVPLRQGMSLLPMTGELFDELTDGSLDRPAGFWKFPGGFGRVLAAWSAHGPLAYVEAEYFGGVGRQCAAAWNSGTLIFGPLAIGDVQPVPEAGTPISQVLAYLGVVCDGHHDEFDAAGLGQHRHTEDWPRTRPAPTG
jgi:hypothetical protein